MRILHYFLGFHRQGGLNRYAADLAAAQAAAGDEVFALYPTGSLLPQKKAKLHRKGSLRGVRCFSLTGGRCVPLLEGIRDPQMILNSARTLSNQAVSEFLQEVRPNVLHIHTWMGFPEEVLAAAKANGTKIVYSTHDYFGLCPLVNRLNAEGAVCQCASNEACSKCNSHAPTERYLEIRNAEILIRLKYLLLPLKKMLHRPASGETTTAVGEALPVKAFDALKQHYLNLFHQCDKLHFNSPVTQEIFSRELPGVPGETIPITHGGIADRRTQKCEIHPVPHLAFFGSSKPYKGLPMLLKVLNMLKKEGLTSWQLDVYGCDGVGDEAVHYHGFYESEEEWAILADTDLLIVPSIWDETFGFVVEEALCAGVPVLCSDRAGARILLDEAWIYSGETGLFQKLKEVLTNPDVLLQEKHKVNDTKHFTIMTEHVQRVKNFYQVI